MHFTLLQDQRSYMSGRYTDSYFNPLIGLAAALTDIAGETDSVHLQMAILQSTVRWTEATKDDVGKEFGLVAEVTTLVAEVVALKESDLEKKPTKAKENMIQGTKDVIGA